MDANCPGHRATVLVAFAGIGRIPVPNSAGKERNDPPPAIAFSAPAKREAISSHACGQVGLRNMLRSFYFAGTKHSEDIAALWLKSRVTISSAAPSISTFRKPSEFLKFNPKGYWNEEQVSITGCFGSLLR